MEITVSLDPVLLEIAGIPILRWYSLAITIAIFVAVWLINREFHRKGLDTSNYAGIATWAIVLGIIGARLMHVFDEWDYYSQNLGQIVEIYEGGLAIWGAVIGGFIGVFIGTRVYHLPLLQVIDAVAPGLVAAQAIGRIGNIVNGDAWGAATGSDPLFAFVYTNPESYIPDRLLNVPTHPYPVYDMVLNLAVLALLLWIRKKDIPHGSLFAIYLVVYGIGRFFIHGWFREENIWALGMQQAQFFSLLGVVVGLVGLAILMMYQRSGGSGDRTTAKAA